MSTTTIIPRKPDPRRLSKDPPVEDPLPLEQEKMIIVEEQVVVPAADKKRKAKAHIKSKASVQITSWTPAWEVRKKDPPIEDPHPVEQSQSAGSGDNHIVQASSTNMVIFTEEMITAVPPIKQAVTHSSLVPVADRKRKAAEKQSQAEASLPTDGSAPWTHAWEVVESKKEEQVALLKQSERPNVTSGFWTLDEVPAVSMEAAGTSDYPYFDNNKDFSFDVDDSLDDTNHSL